MPCLTPVACAFRAAILAFLLSFPAWSPAFAQAAQALPGCEAPAPLLKELNAKLDPEALRNMKYSDRIAFQVETLDQFIAKYPREAEPSRRLIELTWWIPSLIPVLQERFAKQARNSPDDPLAQALAGYSLAPADPVRGLQELNRVKAKAAAFPVPYLLLAELYSYGKTGDQKAMAENISGYFNLCPVSTDHEAQRVLAKTQDMDLQAKVARALRASLEKETDPSRLTDYETLWALEFRTRPPQEHATVRQQVSADLKRMESLDRKPDAKFQVFLVRAYKQSDAPEKSKTWEERIIREYPKSSDALSIVQGRWDKAHERPEDQKDAAAWSKWEQEYKTALKMWVRDFPDDYYLQHNAWPDAIMFDDGLSEKDVLQVFEAYIDQGERSWRPDPWSSIAAVEFLLRHKVQPRLALETVRQAETLLARQQAEEKLNKNRTPQEEKERREHDEWRHISIVARTLHAAGQLQDPTVAGPVRAEVEGPPPESEQLLSYYWLNRGKLAVVEGRKADALAYYQLAYKTRRYPPQWVHGKLYDELGDDARALWKDLGGTDTAFDVWSKPAQAQELTEGYWEKPAKQLPEFELVDLTGKTWKLKELRGKAVLINVWATWCGPCQAELPHIQKLHDGLRDNPDLLVLTLNIDENLGPVGPYLKEKGYRFPVLPAYGFVSNVLDSAIGIPQTWIVDPKGQWQWTEVGFGAENDWEETVTKKLKVAWTNN